MATFRGLLRNLFGTSKYSYFKPRTPEADLAEVVREAVKKGHDGLQLHGLGPGRGRLAALQEMKGLKALELKDARLGDDDLTDLAGLEQLEHLDLSGVPLDGSCLVRIGVRGGGLPNLTHLDLSRTQLVDVAVLALRRYGELASLDLSGTRVTAGALEHLKGLRALRSLRLGGLDLEVSAKQAFAGRPEVELAF